MSGTRSLSPSKLFLLIFALGLLAYAPGLFQDYVYDSRSLRDRALAYRGPEWSLVVNRAAFWDGTGYLTWRPLTALGLRWVDWGLFNGLTALHLLLGLGFHGTVGWLVALIVRDLGGGGRLAGWAGLGAGVGLVVHPLASEVVYCGAFRSDSMAMAAVLGALWLAVQGRTGIAGGVLLAGLLSKETALSGLILIPVAVFLDKGLSRGSKDQGSRLAKVVTTTVVLGVIVAAFLVGWSWFRYPTPVGTYLGGGGRLLGMANFAVILTEITFPRMLVGGIPGVPLRIDHDYLPVQGLFEGRVLVAVGVLSALTIGTVWAISRLPRRLRTLPILGLVLFGVGLAPVSQVLPIPDPVAERLWYPGLVGVALLGGGFLIPLLAGVFRRRPAKPWIIALGLTVVIGWTGSTYTRGLAWQTDLDLNIANWQSFPEPSVRGHEVLAHLLQDRARLRLSRQDRAGAQSDWVEAIGHARVFIVARPDHPVAQRLQRELVEPAEKSGLAPRPNP